jgi:hypothetical protein
MEHFKKHQEDWEMFATAANFMIEKAIVCKLPVTDTIITLLQ